MADIRAIFEKVAGEFDMSVDELRQTLQAALDAVFHDPIAPESKRIAKALAHADGTPPTPEEFFTAMYEAMVRAKSAEQ